MWRENPLWGGERIRGELQKLGIVVSNRSIRRYRWAHRLTPGTQRWRTFLINELKGIWAADLFTVQTLNLRTIYVLILVAHERREVVYANVSSSPTAAWIWQQFIEATPWGRQPKFLIHDRDAVYGKSVDRRLASLGVIGVRTPVRAPRANSIAERQIRTIREDCLDHIIVLNEGHLRGLLKEYLDYYNRDRPHRSLDLEPPVPRRRGEATGITRRSVLGGLHHAYARAA
jgi:transposase InsO family protein